MKTEIAPLAIAAPAKAFFTGTPTIIMNGAIIRVRAAVQPTSRMPEPFFFSSTSAMVE